MIEFLQAHFRYNTLGMLYLSSGLFDISIGLVVLLKDPKSLINRTFFYFALSTFFWVFGYGMLSVVQGTNLLPLWCGIAFIGVPSIPFSIYLFSLAINKKLKKNFISLIGAAGAFTFSIISLTFQEKINQFKEFSWGRFNIYQQTPFGHIFFWSLIGFVSIFLLLAANNFYRGWKSANDPVKRTQSRAIFWGFLFSYVATGDFLITKGIDIYPVGFVACTYLIIMMAYTIVRHRFFDINVVLKRLTLLVVIYSFLLAFSIPLGVAFFNRFFHELNRPLLVAMLGFGGTLGIFLSLGPYIYAALVRQGYWLKDHSATGLTHELKSPLSVIRSAMDVVRDELNKDTLDKSKLAVYSDIIERNTSRLDIFVKDLLNVAKIQHDSIEIEREKINLSNLISYSAEHYKSLAEAKNLKFETHITPDLFVSGDSNKLHQVISNLLSNAIKFTEQGFIRIQLIEEKEGISCSVTDTGLGIPTASLSRIFDRFYQVKESSKGAGIGLTIAKAWVEAHGGKIWAESEGQNLPTDRAGWPADRTGLPADRRDKGTTVKFTLPR